MELELATVRENRRQDEIRVKLTTVQKETIKKLADELGMTMSDYVRYCITKVANEG